MQNIRANRRNACTWEDVAGRDRAAVHMIAPAHASLAPPKKTIGIVWSLHGCPHCCSHSAPEPPGMAWTDRSSRIRQFAPLVAAACGEHRLLLCLALGYIASGGLVLTALGRRWPGTGDQPIVCARLDFHERGVARLAVTSAAPGSSARQSPGLASRARSSWPLSSSRHRLPFRRSSSRSGRSLGSEPILFFIGLTSCFMVGWRGPG